jgi:predicted kinase
MKRVIVLVGLKGAGKSTIGKLIETRLDIPFISVEPIYRQVRSDLGPDHPGLERLGFQAILNHLKLALLEKEVICFETTGASEHTTWLLDELSRLAKVLPVQVRTDPSQCLTRIHSRDASIHIPITDEDIEHINTVAAQVTLPWAAVIDNRGEFDEAAILSTISGLLIEY